MNYVHKMSAGWYTVGPFEIVKNADAWIVAEERDRKVWFLDLPALDHRLAHGHYGRFETLRECVDEAKRLLKKEEMQ